MSPFQEPAQQRDAQQVEARRVGVGGRGDSETGDDATRERHRVRLTAGPCTSVALTSVSPCLLAGQEPDADREQRQQERHEPGTHMMTPAADWSSRAESPPSRGTCA